MRRSAAIQARVDRGFEVLDGRMVQLERTVDEIRRHVSQFEHSVAADLVDIERSIKVHSTAIESSRTAMSQTDDLVERVVEALESLQTTVLDQDEGNERSSFAVELRNRAEMYRRLCGTGMPCLHALGHVE